MNIKFIVAVFAITSIIGGLSYRRKSIPYTRYRLPSPKTDDELTGRIINGINAFAGELPYQLYLKLVTSSKKERFCGGALAEAYGVQFALTAAHCVHDGYPSPFSPVNPRNVRIKAGAHDINHKSGNEQIRTPTKVVIHDQYDRTDPTPIHDIAIMFYADPFKINGFVGTIQLPGYMWEIPERVEISGWGSTTPKPNLTFPDILKVAEMKTLSTKSCKRFEYDGNEITFRHMCLLQKNGIGTCSGDSGGPAGGTNNTNGDWYLAGLLSYHIGKCGSRIYPAVYLRVSTYIDWIHIQANVLGLQFPSRCPPGTSNPGLSSD
ncbi:unnamed protein product [Orchesella dallaii]|uniref:Peptidase S1 domain-containing protein n=1 Tax=Orchesella dallaii TaxID=48710 RepID=A0ABP1RMB2_9HEXA